MSNALSLLDYGGDPTGQTDSASAIANWTAACLQTGRHCYAPAGVSTSATPVLWDTNPAKGTGLWIEGDGCHRTVFSSTSPTAPAFRLGTDTLNSANRGDSFSMVVRGLGFTGSADGPLLPLGRHDFADSINGLDMDQTCVNDTSTSSAAIGLQVNSVLTSRIGRRSPTTTRASRASCSRRISRRSKVPARAVTPAFT